MRHGMEPDGDTFVWASKTAVATFILDIYLNRAMNTPLSLSSRATSALAATLASISAARIIPPFPNDGAVVTMRLFGRSDQNLLTFGRAHFSAMEDNEHFLEPSPSQDRFGAMLGAFADDCAEVQAMKTALATAVAKKNAKRATLIQQLNRRGSYVQSMSWGNNVVITSSALGVQRARKKVGPLPAPLGLQVLQGISEGEVTVTWDKVKHALHYVLEYGVEGEEPKSIPLCGRRKKTLMLPRLGATYFFRMAAIGTSGQSNWSTTVRRIAG